MSSKLRVTTISLTSRRGEFNAQMTASHCGFVSLFVVSISILIESSVNDCRTNCLLVGLREIAQCIFGLFATFSS